MSPRQTRRLPAIDEIDTVVPPASPAAPPQVAKAAVQKSAAQALIPARQAAMLTRQNGGSWTAGAASNSSYAQLIATSPARDWRKQLAFNPLDRLRWWLLRPGRIEFIFWLSGTLLLILVTCALLFTLAFSFQGIGGMGGIVAGPGRAGAPAKIGPLSGKATGQAQGHTTPSSLQVAFTTSPPYTPGNYVGVRGQGFSHNNQVSFALDDHYSILDQHGVTAVALTDATGAFSEILWLGIGAGWSAGHHAIVVHDKATGRRAVLPIILVTTVDSTSASPTVPVVLSTPGVTHTAIPVTPKPTVQGSPVNKTPVPSSPTPAPTQRPTATPTVGKTPTPSASVTPKPTVTTTPAASPGTTPSASSHTNNTTLSNALSQSGDPPITTPLSGASPLVWIMAACYSLSMMLLGLAGVLYKRRPAKSVSPH